MDYSLVGLIVLMIATVVMATRYHRRSWPGRRSYRYQRVFSLGALGLWLTAAGATGWDVRHGRGFFEGATWMAAPVWWELGLGVGLLVIAVWLARRVPSPPRHAVRSPPVRR